MASARMRKRSALTCAALLSSCASLLLRMLSHQVGAFFGAYLGGLAMAEIGNLDVMWIADMALAALAAVVNLPIREAAVKSA